MRGFQEIPLEIVLEKLGPAPKTWSLPEILPGLPRPSAREIKGDLRQMSRLLTQIRQLARKNTQRALVEMMSASKASAFLSEILAPALAGGSQSGIL